jgi:hypothetical protein
VPHRRRDENASKAEVNLAHTWSTYARQPVQRIPTPPRRLASLPRIASPVTGRLATANVMRELHWVMIGSIAVGHNGWTRVALAAHEGMPCKLNVTCAKQRREEWALPCLENKAWKPVKPPTMAIVPGPGFWINAIPRTHLRGTQSPCSSYCCLARCCLLLIKSGAGPARTTSAVSKGEHTHLHALDAPYTLTVRRLQ